MTISNDLRRIAASGIWDQMPHAEQATREARQRIADAADEIDRMRAALDTMPRYAPGRIQALVFQARAALHAHEFIDPATKPTP